MKSVCDSCVKLFVIEDTGYVLMYVHVYVHVHV